MASGACTSESPAQTLDTHTQGCGGNTPLHEIVKKVEYSNPKDAKQIDEKHIQYIKLLLKFHPDVNVKNSEGYTPLHLAVINDRSVNVLKAFTDSGADLNATDGEGRTALYDAVFPTTSNCDENTERFTFGFRDVGTVKYFVEKGSQINTVAKNGYSPLLLAVVMKKTDYVKAMLEKGSDLDEVGLEQTASTHCLEEEYHSMYSGAMASSFCTASYPSCEYHNMTPLLISVYDCNKEMAELLIKAGASVNAVNSYGENALHILTKEFISGSCRHKALSSENKQQQGQIANLLIENGIDLNAKDNSDGTALNYAIQNDKHDIVVYLLERGLEAL